MDAKLRARGRSLRGPWVVLLATGILLAGCGTSGATPSPTSSARTEPTASPGATTQPTSPATATPAPADRADLFEPLVVVVKRGDTLWEIGLRYGVELASILEANPQIVDPRIIHVGDEITIPSPAADAEGPHAFGRFLIMLPGKGPIGWVTINVRQPTAEHPDPGLFMFEALPGVTDYPVSTRAALTATDFYRESNCCGNPASVSIWGVETQYFVNESGPASSWHELIIGLYDVGPDEPSSRDFFRWGTPTASGQPDWQEYYVADGSLTVDLGTSE